MTTKQRIIVQLYEIQQPQEAGVLIQLGVDHIGSVLHDRSAWKQPQIREVVRLVRQSAALSSLIPLLDSEDDILRALDYYEPDLIHFCEWLPLTASEKERREARLERLMARQRRIHKAFPVRIIRSVPVPSPGKGAQAIAREAILEICRRFGPESDFLMTDTLRETGESVQPVAGYVGITGTPCDWQLARAMVEATTCPVILAGGIGPENALEAILQVRPAGIDSCTLTNALDGRGQPIRFRKDMRAVRHLLAEVRRAEEALRERPTEK